MPYSGYIISYYTPRLSYEGRWKRGVKDIKGIYRFFFEYGKDFKVNILLETTAGQGTNLGYRFEQLSEVIGKRNLGICFDTCHVFAAGYDIRDEKSYFNTLDEFDKIIGINRIKVFHMNDSKGKLGSRIDRHYHIGYGMIGDEGFRLIMNDDRFLNIPKIIETPKDTPKADTKNLKKLLRLFSKPQWNRDLISDLPP